MPGIDRRIIKYLPVAGCLLLAGCKGAGDGKNDIAGASSAVVKCTSPQRITAIYRDYVYDLSGYADVSGGSGYNLFDESAFSDPKRQGDFVPVTNPHPKASIQNYFKDNGNRIVIDLQVPYKMSEIYLYDRSHNMDTVWIYTGTMQNWKKKATLVTKGDPGLWGWRKFNISDSTRFVMIRFRSAEANITEAALYGCPLAEPPLRPTKEYAGPRLPPKMMKEFLGVNCYQETPTQWMKPFYYSRVYTYNSLVDFDTVHQYPNIQYNITPHGWYNNGIQDYVLYVDSMKQMGNKAWYSFLGVPKFLEIKGWNNEDRPLNSMKADPEDPMSYSRHANMFWNMAAAYGTTAVDTSRLQAWNEHVFTGRNVMTLYENGNESDAFWNGYKYCNPVAYFAQSSADYDGHEGKMGNRHGIKKADTASELMMAGFSTLDVNRLRVLKFLCNTLRNDKQFLWNGGIQYHYYSNNGKGRTPGQQFMNASAGITPEEDSLRQKLARVRNETYRIQPGVECFLGEYGYDKSRASKVSAPLVPGYNQSQSQGIMLVRAINAIAFSGFDRYIIYWIKDNSDENHPAMYLTSGLLRQDESGYHPYPAWYYISTLVHHLGNYVPETIVSEDSKVWIYKYRNQLAPDSAAYFIYHPTRNGSRKDNYSLKMPNTTGGATIVSFKDGSVTGDIAVQSVQNGSVSVNVSEFPKLVFVKEQ